MISRRYKQILIIQLKQESEKPVLKTIMSVFFNSSSTQENIFIQNFFKLIL